MCKFPKQTLNSGYPSSNHAQEANKLEDAGEDVRRVSDLECYSTTRWLKSTSSGAVICVGGPALVHYVSPTEEELFKKYNPDLQKKSLANRQEKQQEFDEFVSKLKEYSKSDKPSRPAPAPSFAARVTHEEKLALLTPGTVWVVQAEAAEKDRQLKRLQLRKSAEEERLRKETLRREMGLSNDPCK